jgi:hypothetical protein
MGKERWLLENGKPLLEFPKWDEIPDDSVLICMVDNGPFRAAAIAFSEREMQHFTNPKDMRPKTIWYINKDLLRTVVPDLDSWFKQKA